LLAFYAAFVAAKNVPESIPIKRQEESVAVESGSLRSLLVMLVPLGFASALVMPIYLVYLQDEFTPDVRFLSWAFLPAGIVFATWHRIEIVPGVLSMLKGLRNEGYKVCLATNQQANRMRYMRRELGLDDHFDHTFYSCEVGAAKPSADYFDSIMGQLKVAPREVLFIDDSVDNIASAAQCGIHTEHFCVDGRMDPVMDRPMRSTSI
jgi:HAD superfamily hydrolase (TIGR01509 family)